jgi:hypothetical protein
MVGSYAIGLAGEADLTTLLWMAAPVILELHAGLERQTQCPLHLRLALSDAKSAVLYRHAEN